MRIVSVVGARPPFAKEEFLLRVQTTTIRSETKWVENFNLGWKILAHAAEAATNEPPRKRR